MRAFLTAVVFFFFVSVITNDLFAQQPQKDSIMLQEVDSLSNIYIPGRDTVFFNYTPDTAQVNSIDSLLKIDGKGVVGKDKEITKRDSTILFSKIEKKSKWSRPKKIMVMAMILPGSGQVLNHKYWKLPILYAGIGAMTYFWVSNQHLYHEFKREYKTQNHYLSLDPSYTFVYYSQRTQSYYTDVGQLATDRDTYHQYRDMSIAGSVALYAISILDAYVDAHLSTFELNPDLSLSIKPLFYQNNTNFVSGLSLNLKFKNNRIHHNQLLGRDF